MNKTLRTLAVAVVGLGTMIGSAMAIPSALLLGTVDPGSPAAPSTETARLVTIVNAYNSGLTGALSDAFTGDASHDYVVYATVGLPAVPNLPAVGVNNGQSGGSGVQDDLVIDLGLGGYSYAMVKWGNSSEYYYIGGLTGQVTFNNDVNENGESHYDLFGGTTNQVPDGGNTIVMLGLAILAVVGLARITRLASATV